jgi:hypothetical protein
MADYIRQLSGRDIVGASLSIYVRNWRPILAIYLLPVLPVVAILSINEAQQSLELRLALGLFNFVASIFTVGALTIAISDHCLQRPISFLRSWQGAFRHGGRRLLGTYLLSMLLTLVGFVLLIIPGIVVSLMFMFSICAVVLEGVSGWKALRRSRELARGKLWRNIGVLLLVSLVSWAIVLPIVFILAAAVGVAAALIGGIDVPAMAKGVGFLGWAFVFGINLLVQMAVPPIMIAVVLLYYDLRARKEAFDSTALAQELLQ